MSTKAVWIHTTGGPMNEFDRAILESDQALANQKRERLAARFESELEELNALLEQGYRIVGQVSFSSLDGNGALLLLHKPDASADRIMALGIGARLDADGQR